MAKKDKLVKSKSIYTIRKEHSKTANGVIYENDHITIVPNDGLYDEGMALFSESNFKYLIDTNKNSKKKHNRGEYVKPENSSGETWTLNNISGCTGESDENRIVLKPNYSSLKDFAYYGSAVELIRATVNDVILNFPGGLYYYGDKAPKIDIDGGPYYLISNEFNIDCWTGGGVIASGDVKNPMRILAASYMNYTLKDGKTCNLPEFTSASTCFNSIIGTVDFGAGVFSVYMDGEGKKYLVSDTPGEAGDVIIKPKQEFVDKYWSEIDDFTKVLLNRDTTPLYKSVFETPYKDETGYYYQNKSYVWPTISGTEIPDITTGAFQGYIESLISLASFHDEYDSDNIWRMMTHESIKNMDWTFTSKNGNIEEDLSDFDTTGIGAMMRIYGRQFDDIKRYADNIKNTNTITYDEKGNLPDYFLTDTIDNDGWEAYHTAPFGPEKTNVISGKTKTNSEDNSMEKNSIEKDIILYANEKNISYVNSAFQRRLALNSNYIQSMKGTRRGIEAILGMFGYSPNSTMTDNKITQTPSAGTFDIHEYTIMTKSGLSYNEGLKIRCYVDNIYEDEGWNHLMEGLPVAVVQPSGKEEKKEEGYLIPWFDKSLSDSNFYFQCCGGWGKRSSKKINSHITSVKKITSNIVQIYGETQPYLRFAKNINEMLMQSQNELYENVICYVTDISDIEKEYNLWTNETLNDASHYFSLKNVMLSTYCGYINNDLYACYGWKNITNSEIYNANTDDGIRVIYLESLIANYKGNNPHIGNGKYDDGSKYLEYFTQIFKDGFENGLFDQLKIEESDVYQSALTFGFKLYEVEDNKKCAFFNDYSNDSKLIEIGNLDKNNEWNSKQYSEIRFVDTPQDDEITEALDESQANGIINIKKLVINFWTNKNEHLKNYIQDVVLKYLEEMIPSTAILEYRFDGEPLIQANEVALGEVNYKFVRTAHAAIDNENDKITVWREYPTPINEIQ